MTANKLFAVTKLAWIFFAIFFGYLAATLASEEVLVWYLLFLVVTFPVGVTFQMIASVWLSLVGLNGSEWLVNVFVPASIVGGYLFWFHLVPWLFKRKNARKDDDRRRLD